jgi:hypothetical protein
MIVIKHSQRSAAMPLDSGLLNVTPEDLPLLVSILKWCVFLGICGRYLLTVA